MSTVTNFELKPVFRPSEGASGLLLISALWLRHSEAMATWLDHLLGCQSTDQEVMGAHCKQTTARIKGSLLFHS